MTTSSSMLTTLRHRWHWAVISVLALAGGASSAFMTKWGPWAYSDAVGYIVNARNLLTGPGLGLFRPSGEFLLLVTHPPLYSLSLAALGWLNVDLLVAARWIDAFAFAALLLCVGWLFSTATESKWIGIALVAVLLVNPALLLAYASAMSEPLLVLTGMGSLLGLAVYIEGGSRRFLAASMILAGLAFLSRYPGAAYPLTGILCLILLKRGPWRNRWKDAGLFAAISLAPTLGFIAWSRLGLGSRAPRGLKPDLNLIDLLKAFPGKAWPALWSWKPVPPDMIPGLPFNSAELKPVLIVLGLAAAAALGISLLRGTRRISGRLGRGHWRVPAIFLFFEGVYLAFFLAAYVFTSPTPDVNSRTLLPLLPAGLALLAGAGVVLIEWDGSRPLPKIAIATLFLISIAGYSAISQDIVFGLHHTGLGYTGVSWQGSATIRAMRTLPADLKIITNEPSPVLLYTNRTAYDVPGLDPPDPSAIPIPFGTGSSTQEALFNKGQAVLVLFDSIGTQMASLSQADRRLTEGELTKNLPLVRRLKDGAMYCHCRLP